MESDFPSFRLMCVYPASVIRESAPMSIRLVSTLLAGLFACGTASAGPLALNSATQQAPDRAVPLQQVAVQGPNRGGRFLEMLFGGPAPAPPRASSHPPPHPTY